MADKKREKEKSLENAGLAGAQAETVQRYGSAVRALCLLFRNG